MKKKILKYTGITLSILALLVVVFFGVLTVTEYKPKDVVALEINGSTNKSIVPGQSLTVTTWNTGYGALQESADFFMDGGKSVNTATKTEVKNNVSTMISNLKDLHSDIIFLQEVDTSSTRSHYYNEVKQYQNSFNNYNSSFAYNFKTLFVPYPFPPIGKVGSGILTLSDLKIESSYRQKLPCPFSYPVSMCNLKRCLLISRINIEGTDQQLVLVNLHLEAYDSGEGKEAQTKLLKSILEDEVEKGNYVIAGGDFNQVFSNTDTSSYPIVKEGLWEPGIINEDDFSSSLQFVSDAASPTCRSLDRTYKNADKDNFQYYVIDGFIISNNITLNKVKTINLDFKNTDHNPVTMTITLNKNN